jgi:hypothetical protein
MLELPAQHPREAEKRYQHHQANARRGVAIKSAMPKCRRRTAGNDRAGAVAENEADEESKCLPHPCGLNRLLNQMH